MYQGLDYDFDLVMQAAADSGLYVCLCTVTQPSGVMGPSGAPDPSVPYVPVDGMTDIPADVAPSSVGDSVRPTEVKSLQQILEMNMLHVALLGYFPGITQNWRILLTVPDGLGGMADPIEYEITGTESSSQQRQTRLAVQKATI